MVARSDLLHFAEANYRLAQVIVNDRSVATKEAKRIHPGQSWSNLRQWHEAVASTSAQMARVARKVIEGGKGATYTIQVPRSDSDHTLITLTAGCSLLDPSETGYIPLFTGDGRWTATDPAV